MKTLNKRVLALLLAIILIISSATPIFAVSKDSSGQPIKYSQTYNSGQRDVVCTTLSGTSAASYYTGSYSYSNLMSLSSDTLKTTLRTLMSSTHSNVTSYADCKNYSDNTDCENEDGRVSLLYTAYSATMNDWVSGSTGWNREHVWPQSLGGFGTSRAGSDLHHIRPDDNKTNGTRGNNKFGEVSNGSVVTGSSTVGSLTGGYVGGGYMEPHDNVKGDVARICLYVMVRWGSDWGASNITNVFYSIDVLLELCELDPVDTWEMGRNEVVQDIQGNRNVFVDYPELAWLIFDREIPDDMTTPSGEAKNQDSGSSTTCKHSSTTIQNALSATCGTAGYSGDTYCNDCKTIIRTGTTIAVTGKHSFGDWVENGDTQTRTCTTCGKIETAGVECKHTETEIKNAKDETCGAAGYTGDTYCKNCNEKLETGQAISATGKHSYTSWVLDTANGVKTRECTVCGHKDSADINAAECSHAFTQTQNKQSATCGKAGYTGDTCCMSCGQIVKQGSVIAATGNHNYGETVVMIEPTDTKAGLGEQTCSDCGAKRAVKIDALHTELSLDMIIADVESDTVKIILLMSLGVIDKAFLDEFIK